MISTTSEYGFGTTVALDYERAVARVKDELAREGFGILCEIDVAATMKKKLITMPRIDISVPTCSLCFS